MKIVFAPYSKKRTDGGVNAKNYPFWQDTLALLMPRFEMHEVLYGDEEYIGCAPLEGPVERRNLTIPEIEKLLFESDMFLCSDSYLQHMAHYIGKRGVVVFGPSDPSIFGYPENLNLCKGERYFRPLQFQSWNQWEPNHDAFVSPELLAEAVFEFAEEIKKVM